MQFFKIADMCLIMEKLEGFQNLRSLAGVMTFNQLTEWFLPLEKDRAAAGEISEDYLKVKAINLRVSKSLCSSASSLESDCSNSILDWYEAR